MSGTETILIVDDVASNIQMLATVLKDQYNLKVATSGAKALEIVESEAVIDLILLDIEMPDMDGYATLEKLHANEKTKNIPVIFVTGNISLKDEEKGLLAGAVDYITKPISPCIVKARVKTHLILKKQRDQLHYDAIHDRLTGVYNRYQLDREGSRKFARASRQHSKLSVVMLDIDHFKMVNDRYGHQVGDAVLQSVAKVLDSRKRVEDFVVRYGGEEFLILFEDCSLEDAAAKAEKLRKEIESLKHNNIVVTCSFGVAVLQERHHRLEELIKDADEALYKAKKRGRNRVVVAKNEA